MITDEQRKLLTEKVLGEKLCADDLRFINPCCEDTNRDCLHLDKREFLIRCAANPEGVWDKIATLKLDNSILIAEQNANRFIVSNLQAELAAFAALQKRIKPIEEIYKKYGHNIDYIIEHSMGINKDAWQAIKEAMEGK